MSLRRLAVTLGVFLFLLGIFLFLDPKKEESPDVTFWSYDFSELHYTPPGQDFPEKEAFFPEPLQIRRTLSGFDDLPFFEVLGKDPGTGIEFSYEGGYPVKNLFNELTVLRSKTLTNEDPELIKTFSLLPSSPTLTLGSDGEVGKLIRIGEKNRDKSGRYILTENFILTLPNYILEKFSGSPHTLRQNQVFPSGEDSILEVRFRIGNSSFLFENHDREGKLTPQTWFLMKGKLIGVPAEPFSRFLSNLRNLPIDLYPDQNGADGFAVARELTSGIPEAEIEFKTGKKKKIEIHFFPEIRFGDSTYSPVRRKIQNWVESPVFLNTNRLQTLKANLEELNSSSQEKP